MSCSTRRAVWGLTNLTRAGEAKNPIWLYVFNHSMSFDWGKGFEFCNGHSCMYLLLPIFIAISFEASVPAFAGYVLHSLL